MVHRAEAHGKHDDHDSKGDEHQEEEVVERAFIDVMRKQVVRDDLVRHG